MNWAAQRNLSKGNRESSSNKNLLKGERLESDEQQLYKYKQCLKLLSKYTQSETRYNQHYFIIVKPLLYAKFITPKPIT